MGLLLITGLELESVLCFDNALGTEAISADATVALRDLQLLRENVNYPALTSPEQGTRRDKSG